MLKFASIVGYTSCGPMYIESFLTKFGQCINVKSEQSRNRLVGIKVFLFPIFQTYIYIYIDRINVIHQTMSSQ